MAARIFVSERRRIVARPGLSRCPSTADSSSELSQFADTDEFAVFHAAFVALGLVLGSTSRKERDSRSSFQTTLRSLDERCTGCSWDQHNGSQFDFLSNGK